MAYCSDCTEEITVSLTPTPTVTPYPNKEEKFEIDVDSLIDNVSKEDLSQEFQDVVDNIADSMVEENKHKWEVEEETEEEEIKYIRHSNAPKNTRKSYMSYKAITLKISEQYRLQQIAYTGTHGIRQVNGRFCVALGSAYATKIGTHVDIILENGEVIPCILADQKQDIHTDKTNRVCFDGSLVEFVVDTDYIINRVIKSGDVSVVCEEWHPMVEEVIVYEIVEDF